MAKKAVVGDWVKYESGRKDGQVLKGVGKVVAFDEEVNPIVDTFGKFGKVTIILGGHLKASYPFDKCRVVSENYLQQHKIKK